MIRRSLVSARAQLCARIVPGVLCRSLAVAGALFAGGAAAQGVQHPFAGVVPVGQTVSATVTVTPTATGSAGVRVVTNGIVNQDFQISSTPGTCSTGLVLANVPCTVNVTFTPTAPGHRAGAVVLAQGQVKLGQQLIDGSASGPLAVIQPGHADLVAGNGSSTQYVPSEDGGPAYQGHVFLPRGIVSTPAGDFFIADTFNNRIRRVYTPVAGQPAIITTYAGNGSPAATGDGLPVSSSLVSVNQPAQLALDGAGNLYFADTGNNSVRRIDAVTGVITTVAGGGQTQFTTNGIPATQAQLASPYGVALDANGNLYIADTGDSVIRMVDASGNINTVAGTGIAGAMGDGGLALSAQLNQPYGLAFGPDGLLYIADEVNQAIRRLNADGTITTVAGLLNGSPGFSGDGGLAKQAHLSFPSSVAVDAAGNIYIADSQNNRIRRARLVNGSLDNAVMESVVSPSNTSAVTADGTLLNSDTISLSTPYAISLDAQNNLYVTDDFNKRVLLVSGSRSLLRFADMKAGKTSAPQWLHLENDGTQGSTALSVASFGFDKSALSQAADPSASPSANCSTTLNLGVGQMCALGVQFAPRTQDISQNGVNPVGTLTVNSSAANTPDVVTMTGVVLSVEPTTLLLTPNPTGNIGIGQNVTFTAYVTETTGSSTPSGTVTFFDGTTQIGQPVQLQSGIAQISTSQLPLGNHSIVAQYSGDDNNATTQATITETVVQNTTTSVLSLLNPAAVLQPVTFTGTVTATSPITSGLMEFYDGGTLLGTANITANGTATYTVSNLTGGNHAITAKFAGDPTSATSTSAPLTQVINKASTATMVSATPSTIAVGTATTLNAIVSTNGGPAPTGSVTFLSGGTAVGTASLDSTGHASASVSNLVPTLASITAVYSGDGYNNGSTSTPMAVTVEKLNTITVLTTTASPANAGTPVVLSAIVLMTPGQGAVGALTGTVTFSDGANVLGTSNVVNGAASLSTTGLVVGQHSLTATYNGNTNYAVSTSTAAALTVQITGSTTSLNVSASSLIAGNPLTLTAQVTATGTVKPTGTVTFTDGAAVLGSVGLNATTGLASYSLSTLSPGAHSIVATYNGDANYTGGASAAAAVSVRQGNVSLTLTATPARTTYSTPVLASIAIADDGILPANPVVTLLDNGTVVATQTLNASGRVTLTVPTLAVGTHSLQAQFAGNLNNTAAQSATVVVTIDAAATQTVLSSNNLASTFADTVILQAKVSSGVASISGTVTFQDGATVLGISQLNASGVATLNVSSLPVGNHTIVAMYSGDSTHAGSTSASIPQTVTLPTQTAVTASANPAIGGLAVTFTANVGGVFGTSGIAARPTGTITFQDAGATLGTAAVSANGTASLTLSTLSVGTHSITASYAGDTNFRASASAVYTETIRSAATQTVLNSSLTPSQSGAAVTLSARVTGEGATPTGTIVFRDGANAVGQAAMSNGVATLTISTLSPGLHALTANYSGDSSNSPSVSAAVSQQVIQTTQISVVSSSNPALTLQTPVLTAVVKAANAPIPTGTVQFLEGTTLLGTGTLDATGTANITAPAFAAGTHQITAVYAGDVANAAITSQPLALTVTLRATQTSLSATAASQATAGTLSLVAVVKGDGTPGPSGVISFFLNGKALGSGNIDGNGITTLNVAANAVASGTLTASYSGDVSYAASASAQVTLPVTAATNFTLSLAPSTLSMSSGKYATTYLTVQSVNGFSDTLLLGCLGLPYAATCTFEKDAASLASNGQVTVKLIVDTGSPLTAGGEVSSNSNPMGKGALLAALPAGALLALLLRRRRVVPALLAVLMLMMLLPAGGCGTLNQSKTPAGSYTIQVSVSGQNSAYTQSMPVSLTVTQ